MWPTIIELVAIDFIPAPAGFEVLEATSYHSEVFAKLFKKLAEAASDVTDVPYFVILVLLFSYWQRRMSTILQSDEVQEAICQGI